MSNAEISLGFNLQLKSCIFFLGKVGTKICIYKIVLSIADDVCKTVNAGPDT